MLRSWKRVLLLPLLAAVVGGCELADGPSQVAPMAPQQLLGGVQAPEGYTLAQDALDTKTVETLSASELIGANGGAVSLLGHTLTVPAGAVSEVTLFTLKLLPTGFVEVDLHASVAGLDVGSKGFRRPVPVSLTYSRATNVADPSKLAVLRILSSTGYGSFEVLPSVVDHQAKTVNVSLDHFSRYAMGYPN